MAKTKTVRMDGVLMAKIEKPNSVENPDCPDCGKTMAWEYCDCCAEGGHWTCVCCVQEYPV